MSGIRDFMDPQDLHLLTPEMEAEVDAGIEAYAKAWGDAVVQSFKDFPDDDPQDGPEQFYSEDQPRGDDGRWTSGGGGEQREGRVRKRAEDLEKPPIGERVVHARAVSDKLTKIAPGRPIAANEWNPLPGDLSRDPDVTLLAAKGKLIDASGLTVVRGQEHECHTNAAKLWLTHRVDSIVTGYAFSNPPKREEPEAFEQKKNVGQWIQHTWGLKDGKIVETTFKFDKYFGVKLGERDALKFAKAQGVDYNRDFKRLDPWMFRK